MPHRYTFTARGAGSRGRGGPDMATGMYARMMGGAVGANHEYPEWQAGMLGYAIAKDDGGGIPSGRAPGLDPAYGNTGGEHTMVYDPVTRTSQERQ